MVDQRKTIEQLEQDVWGDPGPGATGLVRTCYALRRKPLQEFTPRDLQLMIGQGKNFGLLIPKALDVLEHDPLVEADTFYPGHLLETVLGLNKTAGFWDVNPVLTRRAVAIARHGLELLSRLTTADGQVWLGTEDEKAEESGLFLTDKIYRILTTTIHQFLDRYGDR
jgi:hypothetical protein